MASAAELQEQQIKMAEELLYSEKPKPSFLKMLFAGHFDAERVLPFPNPEPGERKAAEQFVREFNAWADENFDPVKIDRESRIPQSVIDGLGELGLLGMTIPPDFGGKGRSQYAYCRGMEALAARCGGTAVFVNAHHSIGLRALLLFGTEAQKDRWLPTVARGETLAAFALTEPEAGSDAANVQTRAVYDKTRNAYIINGQKQWITNGGIAGVLTLMAKTEVETPHGKEDKITAFLVTPDMPGFHVDAVALDKMAIRGTATAKLSFKDMVVPAENILGPKGGGLKVALTVLDFGRLTFGASCTGVAKECVRLALEHARQRVQFQRPLASFGLVKEKLARMAALAYAMDATTYLTAGFLDRGEGDFMVETAILKVFNSEALWTIVNETMQILGGRAFFTDAPYERMMRDARLNTVGEGANEVLRVFLTLAGLRDVAKEMEGVANAAKNPLTGIGTILGFVGKSIAKFLNSPDVPLRSPLLAEQAKQMSSAIRRFSLSVVKALVKHKQGILEQQMVVNRLADAAVSLYTSTAVLSKLDAELDRVGGKAEALGDDVAVGKLYVSDSLRILNKALDELFDERDERIVSLANKLTGVQ